MTWEEREMLEGECGVTCSVRLYPLQCASACPQEMMDSSESPLQGYLYRRLGGVLIEEATTMRLLTRDNRNKGASCR